jgi:hypothetical protein
MNKLVTTLSAGILALAMSGVTFAAEESQSQAQPTDASKKEQEYLAALKKCEPLAGDDKQKCIDAAKKKFGQM